MILTHLKTSPHTEGEHVDGHVDNLEHDHNFIIETTVESDVRPKKKKKKLAWSRDGSCIKRSQTWIENNPHRELSSYKSGQGTSIQVKSRVFTFAS